MKGTTHEEDLRVIRDETLRCRKIVRGLLDFARETSPQKVPADVNALIDGRLRILEKQANFQNVAIDRRFDRSLPPVSVDVGEIRSVINNLAVNAADAMPERRHADHHRRSATARTGSVVVRVADTGVGITPENLAKLFEPFFTTKDRGQGDGAGAGRDLRRHQAAQRDDRRQKPGRARGRSSRSGCPRREAGASGEITMRKSCCSSTTRTSSSGAPPDIRRLGLRDRHGRSGDEGLARWPGRGATTSSSPTSRCPASAAWTS